MGVSRYFYHSFPRGADANARALPILESILERGLLLTPERIEFREELSSNTLSEPWYAMQKRISFTELAPPELIDHAATFGPFSIEWDIQVLMQMGAIPVFYVPLRFNAGSHEAIACAMLARLGEVQELLVRLEALDTHTRQTANKAELLNVTNNGVVVAQTRCTIGAAEDLLQMLQTEIQPISALTGAIRALSGYFYPVDHEKYTGLLGYYRQREWRLLANMVRLGIPVTVPVEAADVEALLRINNEFFGREVEFPTGRKIRARECQLYRTFRDKPIIQTARKLICPITSMAEARRLLEQKGVTLEVVAMEEYAAA